MSVYKFAVGNGNRLENEINLPSYTLKALGIFYAGCSVLLRVPVGERATK